MIVSSQSIFLADKPFKSRPPDLFPFFKKRYPIWNSYCFTPPTHTDTPKSFCRSWPRQIRPAELTVKRRDTSSGNVQQSGYIRCLDIPSSSETWPSWIQMNVFLTFLSRFQNTLGFLGLTSSDIRYFSSFAGDKNIENFQGSTTKQQPHWRLNHHSIVRIYEKLMDSLIFPFQSWDY